METAMESSNLCLDSEVAGAVEVRLRPTIFKHRPGEVKSRRWQRRTMSDNKELIS
jgi:hypothetical protein